MLDSDSPARRRIHVDSRRRQAAHAMLGAGDGCTRLQGDDCRIGVRWHTSNSAAALKQLRPDARAIILTGYGNIVTAVKAVKLGAVDYLTKPVDADDIVSALLAPLGGKAEAPQHPMSPAHVRLQHIQQVHEATGRNVSETARRLNMHRRTLQRILTRRAGMSDCGSRRVNNSAALTIVVNT